MVWTVRAQRGGGGNARRGNILVQKDSETEQSERVSLWRWMSKPKWGRKVTMSSRKVFLHGVARHEMEKPCRERRVSPCGHGLLEGAESREGEQGA